MKEVIRKFKVFTFDELSETAKEVAKNDFLDDTCRIDDFYNFTVEELDLDFPNSDLDIQFSLNSCQGDGVNIHGNLNIMDCFNYAIKNHCSIDFNEKELKTALFYASGVGSVKLELNRYYCYCNVDSNDFYNDFIYDLENDYISNINKKVIVKMESFIKSLISGFCRDIEKNGYNFLYNIDDLEFAEIADCNNWLFYENGNLYIA